MHPTFAAPFQSEAHLESHLTSAVVLFCGKSQCLKAVGCLCGGAPSWMFRKIRNVSLHNNLLQLAETLRRILPPLGLHKGVLSSLCLLILLIHIKNDKRKSPTHAIVLISLSNTRKENANETFCTAPTNPHPATIKAPPNKKNWQ